MKGVYPSFKDLEDVALQVNQAFKRIDSELARLNKAVAELQNQKQPAKEKTSASGS